MIFFSLLKSGTLDNRDKILSVNSVQTTDGRQWDNDCSGGKNVPETLLWIPTQEPNPNQGPSDSYKAETRHRESMARENDPQLARSGRRNSESNVQSTVYSVYTDGQQATR